MSKLIDRHFTVHAAQLMRENCSPLNLFKILGFCHDISFPQGELSMLTTHEAVFELWSKQELPPIFTNEDGRTLEPGVYLGMTLDEKSTFSQEARSLFLSQYQANHSLHIVEHDHDCQHLYSFVFNQPQAEFLHWTINHIHLLQNFICHYKCLSESLIQEVKRPVHRITLPVGKAQITGRISKLSINNLKIFHKDTRLPVHLAKQQSICLSLLFEGITTREIAERMNLSYCTVQHYLERIRQILGCKSNKELIAKYANQFRRIG